MTDHLGAAAGERTIGRSGYRNGQYERELTTRVGRLQLEVPRDRDGTFSTALFDRYQRSEKALVLSLMQMVVVVQGVSTRRVKKITDQLCGRRFAKSTVSELAKKLDEQVEAWTERDLGECPFLICDALHVKVRRQEAVRSTTVLLAVGVTEEGQREILGLQVALGETQAAWKRLLGQLKERGLTGVEVATSDAHEGLRQAVEESFPGVIWQRCQAHFRRNVPPSQTPSKLKDDMHEVLDSILEASSPQEARAAFGRAETWLEGKADAALGVLSDGWEAATAVLALPPKYRRRLRTSNMIERFIEEIRRREKVIPSSRTGSRCGVLLARSARRSTRNGLPGGATSRRSSTAGKPTKTSLKTNANPCQWQPESP
jgi:transposase-like protein